MSSERNPIAFWMCIWIFVTVIQELVIYFDYLFYLYPKNSIVWNKIDKFHPSWKSNAKGSIINKYSWHLLYTYQYNTWIDSKRFCNIIFYETTTKTIDEFLRLDKRRSIHIKLPQMSSFIHLTFAKWTII